MDDRVFISYSHLDAEVANAICAAVEAGGRKCWMAPRDIHPSAEWAEQIIDGINAANVMVMVFSSSSNKSPQVRREVERAVHREMPVVPFRIEKVMPVKSLEYFLSSHHWFDAFDGPLDAHIDRLCVLLETLGKERADEEPPAWSESAAKESTTSHDAPIASKPPAFREEDIAFLVRELARQIGPIARYLVERASATPATMIDSLAAEFKDPKERAAFAAACHQRLGI